MDGRSQVFLPSTISFLGTTTSPKGEEMENATIYFLPVTEHGEEQRALEILFFIMWRIKFGGKILQGHKMSTHLKITLCYSLF